MSSIMPALFLGHGNPMLTLGDNRYSRAWGALGARLGSPRAILAISAHWYVRSTQITAMAAPRTIHDFGGFPAELFRLDYPAPGAPELAARIVALLRPTPVSLDQDWGLDHGSWTVLRHLFPRAEIPVLQLSLDATKGPQFHYELGQLLAPLRREGILLVASGNLVHDLRLYNWQQPEAPPLPAALRFESQLRQLLAAGNHEGLINYHSLGPEAQSAVPCPDHYLPLLYLLGAQQPGEALAFPISGYDGGSISMLAVSLGLGKTATAAERK